MIEARQKAEAEGGDSKPEGPPILAMAVEPLPEATETRQEDEAVEKTFVKGERLGEDQAVSSLRVSASAVERVAGDRGSQPEASTSGNAKSFPVSQVVT